MANPDVVEVVLAGKPTMKVSLRRCATRLELAGLNSLLGEMFHASTGYKAMKTRFSADAGLCASHGLNPCLTCNPKGGDAGGSDPTKALTAYKAIGDLERAFTERTAPLLGKLFTELKQRWTGGVPVEDFDMLDLMSVGYGFIEAQSLTEGQRKNS